MVEGKGRDESAEGGSVHDEKQRTKNGGFVSSIRTILAESFTIHQQHHFLFMALLWVTVLESRHKGVLSEDSSKSRKNEASG